MGHIRTPSVIRLMIIILFLEILQVVLLGIILPDLQPEHQKLRGKSNISSSNKQSKHADYPHTKSSRWITGEQKQPSDPTPLVRLRFLLIIAREATKILPSSPAYEVILRRRLTIPLIGPGAAKNSPTPHPENRPRIRTAESHKTLLVVQASPLTNHNHRLADIPRGMSAIADSFQEHHKKHEYQRRTKLLCAQLSTFTPASTW